MSYYKMIDDRVALARRLEALLEEHAETTARALAKLFVPLSGTVSEEAWTEDELTRQRLLARWIGTLRRDMVAAGDAHRAQERRLDATRDQREAARLALYTGLVEIRRQARSFFGHDAAAILGIRGRTRRKADHLAQQARTVIHCLEDPVGAWTADPIFVARSSEWLATLQPLRDSLDKAIAEVIGLQRATEKTLEAKQRGMKTFDKHYGRSGRYLVATYRLIGRDDLATLVPPRVARKDRSKSVQTEAQPQQITTSPEKAQRLSPPKERSATMAKVIDLRHWVEQKLSIFTKDSSSQRAENA